MVRKLRVIIHVGDVFAKVRSQHLHLVIWNNMISRFLLSICTGGEITCNDVSCYIRDDCKPRYVNGVCCPQYDNCPPIGNLTFFYQSNSH